MKIQTNRDGFIISGNAEDRRALIASSTPILREVKAIRQLLGGQGRAAARAAVALPQVRRRSAGGSGGATSAALAVAMATASGPVASPRQRAVPGSNRFAPPPSSARDRDERGRFNSGSRPGAAPSSPATTADPDASRKDGTRRTAAALRELRGTDVSQVDPVIAASREIKEVIEPVGRAFGKLFGRDPEKKKAAWFKRVLDSLRMLPTKIADRISMAIPGNQAAGGGIGGVAGSLAGGALGRFGGAALGMASGIGRFALRRAPIIGTALELGSGLFSDRAIANDASLTPDERKQKRVGNAARTAGDVGGVVLGGIIGGAIGGPIGAAMGAAVGPMLVRSLSDTMSPLIGDAVDFIRETSSRIAELVMNGLGWLSDAAGRAVTAVKNSDAGKAVVDGYQGAVDATSNAMTAVADSGAVKAVRNAGKGFTELLREDGSTVRREGARNWRNNNPGNIESGPFANSMGAVGSDGRFAVFPDYKAGRAANEKLIFEGGNYKDLPLSKAISRYAPPTENDTARYQSAVLGAVGGSDRVMSSYSPAERIAIMDAMERQEGFKPGRQTVMPSVGAMPAAVSGGSMALPLSVFRESPSVVMPRASMVMPPQMRVSPPIAIPDAPRQMTPVASNTSKTTVLGPQQDVGQDMKDRNLAHIQTGGLGS